MLIFTDCPVRNCHKKDIYIYIFIFIFIYIGHLFVKHDLANLCGHTREKEAEKKWKRENKRRPIPPTQRSFSRTIARTRTHRERRTRTYTPAQALADTHTYAHAMAFTAATGNSVYVCG